MASKLSLTILGLGIFGSVCAQQYDCAADFTYLVDKIRSDYPGYQDKVSKNKGMELAELELNLKDKIAEHPDSCYIYLIEYASWFNDGHLNVICNGSMNKSVSVKASDGQRQFDTTDSDCIAMLNKKNSTIEGIWISNRGTIAIKKSPGRDKYRGIVIQYEGYEPNQVIFEFEHQSDKEFSTVKYTLDGFQPEIFRASLHMDDKVIEIHNADEWYVRQSDSKVYDNAFHDAYHMQHPCGLNYYPVATYLDDSTYFLRITSFMNDQTEPLVKQHWDEIMARPNLIIDIRNNSGGLDDYYQVLLSLVYSNLYVLKGVEWYASEGNIRNWEEALRTGDVRNGDESIKWINELISAMKQNVGGFVIHPMMGSDVIVQRDTVYQNPKRVGIIINEKNASAAETFLLEAKESSKVLLFGNHNTRGILDYSNCVTEHFPSGRYDLRWPMTRSKRLPEHPIDNIGIPPDVVVPFSKTMQLYDRLDEWVYFVKEYLELMN
jgi:hypothetical protein